VCDAPREGGYWTQGGVAGTAKANDFATDAIFLRGECERNEGDARQVVQGDGCSQETLLANPTLDVL
jgi:hypothetical protein